LWVVEEIVDREWRWHEYANGGGRWNAYYLVKWKRLPIVRGLLGTSVAIEEVCGQDVERIRSEAKPAETEDETVW